ncbi:MAG: quinone-dependent dihydroorotate dehydrogenase [Flavobacteriales bacterium]|nr:quinone-dependent dihydroorotate dehydrogenase [Flavobacteriales bacterium]
MYKALLRPLFFLLPPEKAHHVVVGLFKLLMHIPGMGRLMSSMFTVRDRRLEREVFGLRFPNPVGLAAGFDKDAGFYREFSNLGFGFIEVGTITPKGQEGNPRPRMFRLPKDGGLINRMGFNNSGVQVASTRLKGRDPGFIIGGNIGKNKLTPNEAALDDYLACFRQLHTVVDYFVVNVSSPNTPGLRDLQEKEPLMRILSALKAENARLEQGRPILLKIAPDLTDTQLDDIIEIVRETGIDGVIATNTTISRSGLRTDASVIDTIGMGGLSGRPVRQRSTEVIRYLHTKSHGAFPIVGVGGIHSAADALEKLDAGAALVQIYTGFIYEGPALISEINRALLKRA